MREPGDLESVKCRESDETSLLTIVKMVTTSLFEIILYHSIFATFAEKLNLMLRNQILELDTLIESLVAYDHFPYK
jgi:hypothetical protein